jgi:hypothetical protein
MNAQLDTNLTEGPTLGVQVGCTLNVHGVTVTGLNGSGLLPNWEPAEAQARYGVFNALPLIVLPG